MNFYTPQHNHYCGIDLHAKARYVCILDQSGTKLVPKNLPTTPAAFWRMIAPYRADWVVGVACSFTGYGLADLWAQEGSACVLGHALYMQAIPGGKAQNDTSDAHKSAVLLRGGRFPQASGYPAALRATRALLRRRGPVVQNRAELWAPMQTTHSQYTLPESGKPLASKANRAGVEAPFPAPSVRQTIAVEGSLLNHSAPLVGEVALYRTRSAKAHEVQTVARLQSVPGSGQSLARVIVSELQDSARFPRGPDFGAYGRLVKCAQASNTNRLGPAGTKIGTGQLRWAFAAAAVLC